MSSEHVIQVCRVKNCESMIKNYSAVLEFLNNKVKAQIDKDVVEAIIGNRKR